MRAVLRIRRRSFLGALFAGVGATLLRRPAHGQTSAALPLENLGLEHLDIVVPDTAASARFYKRVFSSPLHEQEFRGGKRYFVLLGDLPPDRQVGYIAIGAANGRPIAVGHYCALAKSADLAAIGKELAAAGYPEPGGGFGLIPDPDGLELQLFTLPAGLVTAATPSSLDVANDAPLTPLGLHHVLIAVGDLERALRYYRFLYGEGIESRDAEAEHEVRARLEFVHAGRDMACARRRPIMASLTARSESAMVRFAASKREADDARRRWQCE